MILAHKNGTMIAVKMVHSRKKSTVVQEIAGTTTFTLKIGEVNRELFDGKHAVKDAEAWIKTHIETREREAYLAKYPLEIESVGSETYIVMSRGHHDLDAFMAAVREEGYDWPLGKPEHRWVKSVPDKTGKYTSRYVLVEQGTKGAWPATYSWEASGEYLYIAPEASQV